MLKKIQLINYRCFVETEIEMKDLNIMVGKNNAGKSTLIEAFRLISWAGIKSKSKTNKFIDPPVNFDLPKIKRGILLNVDKLKIDLETIGNYYNDSVSSVIAIFENGTKIEIYIKDEKVFAVFYDCSGRVISTSYSCVKMEFNSIRIMPPLSLIKENEKLLLEKTVNADKETYLYSRHFRNELYLFRNELFQDFKRLAEETWEGLIINDIEYDLVNSEYIQLFLQDERFPSEIGNVGSGLQMWLQIIWFVCRSKSAETIILDEPDVYMHPDLQRKILFVLKRRFPQVIIATHSVEIISEVEPQNIVVIDKNKKKMNYANNDAFVQSILNNIGSIQNISLIRFANLKKCIFVEGQDMKILSKFHRKLYPLSNISLEILPTVPLGGFSKLSEAFGASKLFYENTDGLINAMCILDSDYYPEEYLEKKKKISRENHLDLHIWDKKEIENYLLNPDVIFRITKQAYDKYDDFMKKYEAIIESKKDEVCDKYSQKLSEINRGWDISKCNSTAREFMKKNWTTLDKKISLVSGKEIISKINMFIKEEYGEHCSIDILIKEYRIDEIDEEVRKIIDKLIK